MCKKISKNAFFSPKILRWLFIVLLAINMEVKAATNLDSKNITKELPPWSGLLYYASTATQVFGELLAGKYNRFGEDLYTAELAYTLDPQNAIHRFFQPVFDVVQIASNITYRHDNNINDNVTEGNLYLIWRFTRFPWDHYLKNSIAIGDGISYASHSPLADRNPKIPISRYSKLLNYLMLEATFAMPRYPEWQVVVRVHHRCTAWGTYPKKANAGSTSIGFGIRYYF